MTATPEALDRYFAAASHEYPSRARLQRYLERLFDGCPLDGRSVLDIGGGNGAFSFYAAVHGARVRCLEPGGDGSNSAMQASFDRFASALSGVGSVELDARTFQEFEPGNERYDVVLMHNSVNHIDEDACRRVGRDTAADDAFVGLFRKLADMMTPGGDLIVADCSRLNAFGQLHVRNPFVPDIEWDIHQQPSTWARLLERSGFTAPRIRWNPMTRAGRPGAVLLSNWAGAFLTSSHFTLSMRRGASVPSVVQERSA